MTRKTQPRLAWRAAFMAALAEGASVKAACRAAGVSSGAVYSHRNRKAAFAAEWDAAQAGAAPQPDADEDAGDARARYWRAAFFEALAETSNIATSAARVNVPARTIYKLKREDAEFAGRLRAALIEGYDRLEMELLGYVRDPQPGRKMDVGAALRLLAAHREAVERQRALMDEEDENEEAMLESLDRYLAEMRQRRRANAAILAEAEPADAE